MSQSVKIYGVIFLVCVCLLIFLDFNHQMIVDDTLFEAVRTTQSSVMEEALNKGDLIVNEKLSVSPVRVMKLWREKFDANHSLKPAMQIRFVDIHEEPAAVAVSVSAESQGAVRKERMQSVYDSVIVVDGPVGERS